MNPILPTYEYIPDVEPRVFNDRLYLYGSHDKYNGSTYCENNYVTWSALIDDLSNWRYEGVIYRKNQDPSYQSDEQNMYAPDVVLGLDNKYYLYYCLEPLSQIGVAVSNQPNGPFAFLDYVRSKDGTILGKKDNDFMQFDPAVLVDDNHIYLYSGQGITPRNKSAQNHKKKGPFCYEIEHDMITVKKRSNVIVPILGEAKGTKFEGHEFFEASSIRKYNDIYYFIYSSTTLHDLCYAYSKYPDCDFVFGGPLISIADIGYKNYVKPMNYIGNIHGGMTQINDDYFIFYHRQTNRTFYSRQTCAEKLHMYSDGMLSQSQLTSQGLVGKPLPSSGTFLAANVCNLMSASGATYSHPMAQNKSHPALVQETHDEIQVETQYIENLKCGSIAGFKYFDFSKQTPNKISIKIRTKSEGEIIVSTDLKGKNICAKITVAASNDWKVFTAKLKRLGKTHALYFTFQGKSEIDFFSFNLMT